MEYGIGEPVKNYSEKLIKSCLNPCLGGIWNRSYMDSNDVYINIVLILVWLEYGIGVSNNQGTWLATTPS